MDANKKDAGVTVAQPSPEITSAKTPKKFNFEVVQAGYISKELRLCFLAAHKVYIPDELIRRHSLEKATHVQLLYDRAEQVIGLKFHEGKVDSLSPFTPLEKTKGKQTFFSVAGFLAAEKITVSRKKTYMDFVESNEPSVAFVLDFGNRWQKKE